MQDDSQAVPYEIVHSTVGRIRLRVPQLKNSEDYANRLQQKIASHGGVTEVRLNSAASSVVITYRPRVISEDAIQAQIRSDIQQARTLPAAAPPETKPIPERSAPEQPAPVDSTEAVDESPAIDPIEPSVLQQPVDSQTVWEQPTSVQAESLSNRLIEAELTEPSDSPAADQSKVEPVTPVSSTEPESCPAEPEVDSTSAVKGAAKDPAKATGLSQRMLAKRLHVSNSSLRHQRTQPGFAAWSAAKDPEGKGWRYDSQSSCFYPVTPRETN